MGWLDGRSSGQAPTLLSPVEQGVILVTEHNAELNAGFVVLLGSNHAPPLSEDIGKTFHLVKVTSKNRLCQLPASAGVCILAIGHGRDDRDMTPEESGLDPNGACTHPVLWLYHEYLP